MGSAAWETVAWISFCNDLCALFSSGQPTGEAAAYLSFDPEGATEATGQEKENQQVILEGQVVRLGSIHSVKGRTVDAMLVVESEVYRGAAADERTMDLATVLPHAFGIENRDLSTRPVDLAAATYVFVGITRPRHFLALALRKSAATTALIEAAVAQGWIVKDLTLAV